ncbi:MAG: PadR family transcriptional regulator [Blastocatellia bacterium]
MGKSFLSFAAAVILQALDNGYKYGFDIMDVTGLPSGTVYPALRRLEDNGYVFSKWEKHSVAQEEARPPRKYYELTSEGRDVLADARSRYRLLEQAQTPKTDKPKTSRA